MTKHTIPPAMRARILAARLGDLYLAPSTDGRYKVCGQDHVSPWTPFTEAVERLCAEHAARQEPGEWRVRQTTCGTHYVVSSMPSGESGATFVDANTADWNPRQYPTAAHALIAMLDRLDAERGEVAATDMECVIIGKCDDLRALVAELEAALLAEMDALKSHPILAKKHTGMRDLTTTPGPATTPQQSLCEICSNWARSRGHMFTHHEACPRFDPFADMQTFATAVVSAMDAWAADEDGIHDDAWGVYQEARGRAGMRPAEDDTPDPAVSVVTMTCGKGPTPAHTCECDALRARVAELEADLARLRDDRRLDLIKAALGGAMAQCEPGVDWATEYRAKEAITAADHVLAAIDAEAKTKENING